MEKYDPKRIARWNGMSFRREDGGAYTIQGCLMQGPDITKALPLFIGSISPHMGRDERLDRIKKTEARLKRYIREICAPILEKRERTMELDEIYTDQERQGLYEVLETPQVGYHFGFAALEKTGMIIVSCRSPLITEIERL